MPPCRSKKPIACRKAWHVYIVECADGTLYCGATNDVKKRIAAHNAGVGARYTSGRRPVRLFFQQRFPTKSRALQAEARIKRLSRRKKLTLFSLAAPRRTR